MVYHRCIAAHVQDLWISNHLEPKSDWQQRNRIADWDEGASLRGRIYFQSELLLSALQWGKCDHWDVMALCWLQCDIAKLQRRWISFSQSSCQLRLQALPQERWLEECLLFAGRSKTQQRLSSSGFKIHTVWEDVHSRTVNASHFEYGTGQSWWACENRQERNTLWFHESDSTFQRYVANRLLSQKSNTDTRFHHQVQTKMQTFCSIIAKFGIWVPQKIAKFKVE